MNWQICGSMFPMRIDFNKLCGNPPVYITMYDLAPSANGDRDQRHLASRKRHYLHVAAWSTVRPPKGDFLSGGPSSVAVKEDKDEEELLEADLLKITAKLEDLPDLISMDDIGTAPAAQAEAFDLLGLDFAPAAPQSKEAQPQKAK